MKENNAASGPYPLKPSIHPSVLCIPVVLHSGVWGEESFSVMYPGKGFSSVPYCLKASLEEIPGVPYLALPVPGITQLFSRDGLNELPAPSLGASGDVPLLHSLSWLSDFLIPGYATPTMLG